MSWRKSVKRAVAPVAASVPWPVSGTPGAILCYHGVGALAAPEVVAVEQFRRQLDVLLAHFRVTTMTDLVARIGEPDDREQLRVAFTFDDGYKGVIHLALPLLRDAGVLATAYVLPGLWGRTAPWPSDAPASERILWDEDDARTWVAEGMELGSHGSSHVDLSVSTREVIDREVAGSRQILEGAVGHVEGFCYPWGRSSALARERVRAAGYRYAVAGGYSRYHGTGDLYALGRITVDHDDTVEDLLMKLRGGYDWLDGVGRLRSKMGSWRSS